MVVLRDQNDHARPLRGLRQPPLHRVSFGDGREVLAKVGEINVEVFRIELDSHEEQARFFVAMLVGMQNVAAMPVDEIGDGRDFTLPVGAGDEQDRGSFHRNAAAIFCATDVKAGRRFSRSRGSNGPNGLFQTSQIMASTTSTLVLLLPKFATLATPLSISEASPSYSSGGHPNTSNPSMSSLSRASLICRNLDQAVMSLLGRVPPKASIVEPGRGISRGRICKDARGILRSARQAAPLRMTHSTLRFSTLSESLSRHSLPIRPSNRRRDASHSRTNTNSQSESGTVPNPAADAW